MNRFEKNIVLKLNHFIKEYYRNELIKGLLISLLLLVLLALVFIFSEYFFGFNSWVRGFMFYSFIGVSSFVVIQYILFPIFGLLGLKNDLTSEKAAKLIGDFFPEVSDKLLNSIQLQQAEQSDLVLATISKKEEELRPFNFEMAIQRNWMKSLIPSVGILLIFILTISWIRPDVVSTGSKHIFEYDVAYHLIPPFEIQFSDSLRVKRGEDFDIQFEVIGDEIPQSFELKKNDATFIFQKEGLRTFQQTVKQVKNDVDFYITSGKYILGPYTIEVLSNPRLTQASLQIDYPDYLDRKSEEVSISKNITIPVGSTVKWKSSFEDANQFELNLEDTTVLLSNNKWTNPISFIEPHFYSISSGLDTVLADYQIQVIPDAFPKITASWNQDSVYNNLVYVNGVASDDYGILSINLVIEDQGKLIDKQRIKTPVFGSEVNYSEVLELDEIQKKYQVDNFDYYFEVWDNDGVNGSKHARTAKHAYIKPSFSEKQQQISKDQDSIEEDIEKAFNELKDLQSELQELKNEKFQSKQKTWSDQQRLKKIEERYKNVRKDLKDLVEKKKQLDFKRSNESKQNEELMQKQEELNKMFNENFDEETKELMQKISEMLEKMQEQVDPDKLEQLEMSNEEMLDNLDRNLELFKQLEFQMSLEESLSELEKLADKQDSLANSNMSDSARSEAQDKLNKEFDELQNEFDKLEKKNDELANPMDMDWADQERQEADDKMNQSSSDSKKGNSKQSQQNQKDAADKMKEAQQKMQNSMMSSMQAQQEEDMENLRTIQENLLQLSFNQESIMTSQLVTDINDPMYRTLNVEQLNIQDDFKVIEDSLQALSKRVMQLESIIKKEVQNINYSLAEAKKVMEARNKAVTGQRQHEAMTSMNNLALLLSEVIQQMQQQMAQQKFGESACQKPGQGKKPNMSKMKSSQEGLKKQMEMMKQQLEKGKSPGKQGKEQQKGKGSKGSQMSEELAKMAAQQQALREAMQKLSEDATKAGDGLQKQLRDIEREMEQVEDDILYRQITEETLKRQEDILSRMLESEKALREQEQDEQRESNEGSSLQEDKSAQYEEYIKQRQKELELLRLNQIRLSQYYEQKVNSYLYTTP